MGIDSPHQNTPIDMYSMSISKFQNFRKFSHAQKGRGPFLQNRQSESWGTPGIFYWDHNEWNKTPKSLFQSSFLTDTRFDRTNSNDELEDESGNEDENEDEIKFNIIIS